MHWKSSQTNVLKQYLTAELNGMPVTVCKFLFVGCVILLSACRSETAYRAPVSDIGQPSISSPRTTVTLTEGPRHRVNEGETLYAIAWMYDLNYQALAQANNIAAPYVIFPGQILSLDTDQVPVPAAQPARPAGQPAVTQNTPITRNPIGNAQSRAAGTNNNLLRWMWPANGRVIGSFSSTTNAKGIDIAGNAGDPVYAAEAGEVVYAGSALLRYGELIIIKHNDQFLSAYAHNDAIHVAEGDRVSRGQQIANLGSTGIDRDMLHFEIRLAGEPVNPVDYLPPR